MAREMLPVEKITSILILEERISTYERAMASLSETRKKKMESAISKCKMRILYLRNLRGE